MKRLALTLSLISISLCSQAQVGDYRSELALGITGGINMANVNFSPSMKKSSLSGKNIGFVARYTCEKYIKAICAIQVECNYATQGWKEVEDESPATFSKTMNYVQVPFLARLAWGHERKGAQGYILLGPQMGFLLSESQKADAGWDMNNRTHTYQYTHDADRKFDYGIALAAGTEISSPKLGHVQLEARYYYGLRDFYDNNSKGYFGRSCHTTITIRAGFLIDIIKSKNSNIR